jgi:hypothetical protein
MPHQVFSTERHRPQSSGLWHHSISRSVTIHTRQWHMPPKQKLYFQYHGYHISQWTVRYSKTQPNNIPSNLFTFIWNSYIRMQCIKYTENISVWLQRQFTMTWLCPSLGQRHSHLTDKARFSARAVQVGFMVDKKALEQIFSSTSAFPCQSPFHKHSILTYNPQSA